jgi:hypothetical protein
MATLIPVDHDPFAASPSGNLIPVDHDPFASSPQQPSTAMDAAKTVASNTAQGAMTLPFMFANLGNQIVAGPQLLGRGIAENADKMLGIDPQPRGDVWQPFYDSNDASRDLGINYQPKTTIGKALEIPSQMLGAFGAGKVLSSPTTANLASDNAGGGWTPPPPRQPPPSLGANADALINGSPDIRTYAGQQLGQKIQTAEQAARADKDMAYKVAIPALEQTNLPVNSANNLSSALIEHANNFDTDLVPAAKLVKKYAGEIASTPGESPPIEDILLGGKPNPAPTNPTSLDQLELMRQKLNNIPVSDNATGKLVSGAKKIFDEKMDEYVNNGVVNGDPKSLALIKDARAKNAYWRQKFTGNDANNVIGKYIESVGGKEQIAPENLLDMFTNVGQAGLDAVKSAKDILGKDAMPMLKNGFIEKIRSGAVDANGINPSRLAARIDTIMKKSPTLMGEVFSTEEMNALRAVQREAFAYGKGGKGNPGMVTKLTSKLPGIGPLVEDAMKSRIKDQMTKDLTKAATGSKK